MREQGQGDGGPRQLEVSQAMLERLNAPTLQVPSADSSDAKPVVVCVVGPDTFDARSRYVAHRTLGVGGMGEVHLCSDGFVGRHVAMKLTRQPGDSRERFLREARVQGQLEHPSIVPVYDIGVGEQGQVFFTMKRVVGRTLEEILAARDFPDDKLASRFPLRRLLAALSQLCLALDFVHQRGVVHRDLKPANIMLGDFGEVYLLDWGVAKVAEPESLDAETSAGQQTLRGMVIGTPGYMSPEQARGAAAECDARADVYSLGAILFEVLTETSLHEGDNVQALLDATLALDGARPLARRPGIAPELDEICWRATRLDPADRFASARALHQQIEQFLDGERDRELRSGLADAHAARAEALLGELERSDRDALAREQTRTTAMRELGAALALEPGHPGAQHALLELLLEDPDDVPPTAEDEMAQRTAQHRRSTLRAGASATVLAWLAMLPLLYWMGIRSGGYYVAFMSLCAFGAAGIDAWIARSRVTRSWHLRAAIAGSFLYVSAQSLLFGPLVYLPQIAISMCAFTLISTRGDRRLRLIVTLASAATMAVPLLFMFAGLLPNPYSFENGALVIAPLAVGFRPLPTLLLMTIAPFFSVFALGKLIGDGVEASRANERRSVGRAHRLRALLPVLEQPAPARGGPQA